MEPLNDVRDTFARAAFALNEAENCLTHGETEKANGWISVAHSYLKMWEEGKGTEGKWTTWTCPACKDKSEGKEFSFDRPHTCAGY